MRLFEFGDMKWTPDWYHLYMRRYLVFYYRLFRYFRLWTPAISRFFESTGARSYLECCSGSGKVLELVISDLPEALLDGKSFILSDLNLLPEFVGQVNSIPDSKIRYYELPVDATRIPENLNYPRIFINSFHHFSPDDARQIIQSSIQSGQGLLILEYVRHSVLGYLSMLTGSSLILATLPFVVMPRHLPLMALFTYILPVFPLMFLWDGIVSCMRTYSPVEITRIISEHGIPARTSDYTKRSLLYPAGVSAISILPAAQENGEETTVAGT